MKRIIFLILTVSFAYNKGYSQFSPVWNQDYQHTTTAGFSNEGRKVVIDASGNIFTLSDVTSDLDINGIVGGGSHHYSVINKYSTTGTLLAQKVIEVFDHRTSGFDQIGSFGLEVDASGNVFAAYCPWDTGWATNYNVEVQKFDNNLNTIWRCLYVTNGNDYGVDMRVTPGGDAYVIANSTNGGSTIYYLLKFASQGAPTTVYVFANNEAISDMALNNTSQDVYVTGYRLVGGKKNFLVVAINSVLQTQKWYYSKNIGSTNSDDYGTSVTIGVDGFVYAAGVEEGSPDGNNIIVLRHTERAGKVSWIGELHYSATDNSPIVRCAFVGYVYVAAASENAISLYKFPSGSPPPRGIFASTYKANTVNTNMGVLKMTLNDMKISVNEKVYITGGVNAIDLSGETFYASYLAKMNVVFSTVFSLAYDQLQEGDMSQSNEGIEIGIDASKSDIYWLVNSWDDSSIHLMEKVTLYDLDVTLPLRKGNFSRDEDIKFFPNPANDYLNIRSQEKILRIQILEITGQVIMDSNLESNDASLNVSSIKAGVYFCRLNLSNGTTKTERILIQ